MKIEIWSDIACPWCYIGKRRLETALNQFEHRDQVEIVWRSFQLDPTAPREYEGDMNTYLAEKKGIDPRRAEMMHQQVTALAAQEGLEYHFEKARVGNSFDAHRLLQFAAKHGLQNEMKERLQYAYFTEGQPFGDPDTLVKLAVEVGLNGDEVRQMLASNAHAADVSRDVQRARMIGVQGVPFFLFDEKFAVSGAQPADLFSTALDRAWQDSHPVVEIMGANTAEAGICDDESCTV